MTDEDKISTSRNSGMIKQELPEKLEQKDLPGSHATSTSTKTQLDCKATPHVQF